MQAFVPKARKPKFELVFKIIYLNNVPLVTGACYAKWSLPSSTAAEHRGKTARAPIKDHLVTWDYEKHIDVRLVVDKTGTLQASELEFEVVQEWSAGAKVGGERALLGVVRLNLAEYVLPCDETEEPVCRRYLMQESKINSTVKISIFIRQTEGDRNFVAPPLKTAPIFGNISGIINFEQNERDESGHLTSMSTKVNRDIHEMRAVYRQTLTAAWSTQGKELPADECIEDIFAGGDGFGSSGVVPNGTAVDAGRARGGRRRGSDADPSDEDRTPTPPPAARKNSESTPRPAHHRHSKPGHHHQLSKSSDRTINGRGGRGSGSGSSNHQNTSSSSDDRKDAADSGTQRLTEADLRADMRTWHIGPPP